MAPRRQASGGGGPRRATRLWLRAPADFRLEPAVRRYGFYALAPNGWDEPTRSFTRVLRDRRGRAVDTRVRQSGDRLLIHFAASPDRVDRDAVRAAVSRMLRLDEDFTGWWKLSPAARREGFARLLRSPTLFEDVIKTITCCNVAWRQTIAMNRVLCEQFGGGAFPTPAGIVAAGPLELREKARVGYRAERMVEVAEGFVSGRFWLDVIEDPRQDDETVYRALRELPGVGDFAACNVMQLLGRYGRLAIDSETYRHVAQFHGLHPEGGKSGRTRLNAAIIAHYRRFAPYDFLAYWRELWNRSYDGVI